MDVGTYTLTVTTKADNNHNPITKTANITVNKIDSTLSVNDIVFDYNGKGSTTISYAGANGVTAKVANQPNAVVNVKDNTITVSNLNVGTYTLSVTTIADNNHNPVTKTATITVNKVSENTNTNTQTTTTNNDNTIKLTLKTVTVKKSAKKLVLKATLKINGKAKMGLKVIFKFNGKKYTAKTNKKGIAKVTIKKNILKKLKVGKKVKYQASYGKTTVKKNS